MSLFEWQCGPLVSLLCLVTVSQCRSVSELSWVSSNWWSSRRSLPETGDRDRGPGGGGEYFTENREKDSIFNQFFLKMPVYWYFSLYYKLFPRARLSEAGAAATEPEASVHMYTLLW